MQKISTGYRFKKLVYLHDVVSTKKGRMALFQCDCGNKKIIAVNNVRAGRSSTCGCEQFKDQTKHGRSNSVIYQRWGNMRSRCNNPNFKHYYRYGGRGITICKEWDDFNVFHSWAVKNGFTEHLTLDRKDNNQNYTPQNCRWANRAIQSANRNKRKDTKYKYIGVNKLPSENWRASICIKGKQIHIGIFSTEQTAMIERNNYIKLNKLPHKLNK